MIRSNAAISAGVKAKQPDKAVEHREVTRQKGLEQDLITYSAAISTCAKASA